MKTKFKKGDWMFAKMELQQIKKLDEEGYITISNGQFQTSSSEFDMYPLEMGIKRISDYFKYYYDKLYSDELKPNSLNYPDIGRHFNSKWAEACEAYLSNDTDKSDKLCEEIANFYRQVFEKLRDMKWVEVDGVSILRK